MADLSESHSQDIRPIPDPTLLTQEASSRLETTMRNLIKVEIGHQRELFDEKIEGVSHQFESRISAMNERSTGFAHQYNEKLEGIVNQYNERLLTANEKLHGLSAQFAERISTHDERFATHDEKLIGAIAQFGKDIEKIYARFDMLDARTAEQKSDTKAALDAALAAQKEAVAAQTASSDKSITKSETATIERIKAVETLLSASTKASDDKISDLKDRIGKIEAAKLGAAETTADTRASGTDIRSIVAVGISIVLLIIAIASVLVAVLKP